MRTPQPRTGHARTIMAAAALFAAVGLWTMMSAPARGQIILPGTIQGNPGGPYSGLVGQPVFFSGSLSTSFGFGVAQYQWSFGDGSAGFGQTASHAYLTPGSFIVTLTVIDPSGLSNSSSTTATVSGANLPIVVNPGGPYTGAVGTLLTFIGTVSGASFTPYQYQYNWNFGDGFTGSGQSTAHAYNSPGTFNVTLTVSSPTGQSGYAATTASIRQSLSISAGTSTTGVAARPVNFGATVTGGTNPTVTWNFGDGTRGTGQFTNHAYTSAGRYTVTASAVDATGAQASDTITATISQSLIVDSNGPYTGIAGKPIAVISTVTGAVSPVYRWDFGDGTGSTSPNPTHVYRSAGTYTITLSVTDTPTGQSATDSAVANIQGGGPVVTYAAGWNIVAGPQGTVFSDAASSLFTFQANDSVYQVIPQSTPTQPGYGYWAYFTGPENVTLSGVSRDSATIQAPSGQYIMVGNPSATSAVTIKGADTAVSWDPQASNWKSVSALAPGAGAWVISQNGGTITLSP